MPKTGNLSDQLTPYALGAQTTHSSHFVAIGAKFSDKFMNTIGDSPDLWFRAIQFIGREGQGKSLVSGLENLDKNQDCDILLLT